MFKLLQNLGFNETNGLFITKDKKWLGIFPKRIDEFFSSSDNAPDAFFCLDNKPFILFYDKPGTNRKNKLFKSIWNFNESPIVFIVNDDSIEIFNGFKYLKDESKLEEMKGNIKLTYENVINGVIWKQYEKNFNNQSRVDYHLLKNIDSVRQIIIKQGASNSLANRLIGKIIFIRYLIDRKVKVKFNEYEYLTNDDLAEILDNKELSIKLFKYIQEKFNGNLFNITDEEYNIENSIFSVLRELILGSTVTPHYIQPTLFDIYDFSIIPVEFISNVYELFIGIENQTKSSAYYTPVFLVDYILKDTIEKFFIENPTEYNCKILDPACGSGVFLVEAYRKIIAQYEKINPDCNNDIDKYKETLKQLAIDNIFGIDKDQDSVSVATFSIFLTMLHYQKPADIENFRFPNLSESNFFVSDFFNTELNTLPQLKKINFIIGNPPWKRGKQEDNRYMEYINDRKKNERDKKIEINNKEIAQAFLIRSSDFSDENTQCALIVTSKILYNIQSKNFRSYFLDNFYVNKIFEMAPVRREVFSNSQGNAIAPPVILFYKFAHNRETDENIVKHITLKPSRYFTMFKIFNITRNDYKEVQQSKLKEYDYLWKILVYGSYLDFNLIRRLKEGYKTIGDVIFNNEIFLVGQGVMIGGGDRNDATHFFVQNFLDTKNDIDEYYINDDLSKWDNKIQFVHRPRKQELFQAPVLLTNEGVTRDLRHKSAILYDNAVYLSSITGIKTGKNNINELRKINAHFNSSFFSYNMLLTGSSAGIEREQTHDQEKWQIPYNDNFDLSGLVEKIENLKKQYHIAEQKPLNPELNTLSTEIDKTLKKIDEAVLKGFNLSEEEYSLIDYAVEVTVPLIMKHKGCEQKILSPIDKEDILIQKYIDVFLKRFNPLLIELGLCYEVSIWYNKDFIGMFFSETSLDNASKIKYQDKTINNFLTKLAALSTERITDKLFIHKDIRGFEQNGFYIIKPNEKRLWHKTVAYLDMYEFADAILEAGRV